jgi:3-deoxy-D-manno-octulosonate 8-phosphate phosphatase (KDO 8-P phosphatase)
MSPEIVEKLKNFKGLILDADGVWFDGYESRSVMPDKSVVITKRRHFHDAQGLSFLRGLGIKVVFATGEGEPLQSIVEKINDLPSVKSGEWAPVSLFMGELKKGGKVESLEAWFAANGLTWEECVYIGDDRTDLEAMQLAGLKVAPANARRLITKIADVVLTKNGGEGAVREFAEMVLDARGVDEATLSAA